MQKISEHLQSGKEKDLRNHLDRIRRVLKKHEYQWFDKAEVWSFWPGCIEKLGLLGQLHLLQEYKEKVSAKSTKVMGLTRFKRRGDFDEECGSTRRARRKRYIR
ncbi:hypothetical protein IV04_24825 [Serratia sp. Ag1]|nr:hypothetical protein IV04_24825 [Serratia sp. Ag1]